MIKYLFRAVVLFAVLVSETLGRPVAASTEFDGNWSATFVTRAGDCLRSLRLEGRIVNGTIAYTGPQSGQKDFSARVASSGTVHGTISAEFGHAVASGRLLPNSGSGTWRGQFGNTICSGTWSATRI
jgi:hypothetical protein